jgi:hypothetical protein
MNAIRREERRLARVFGHAVLLASLAPLSCRAPEATADLFVDPAGSAPGEPGAASPIVDDGTGEPGAAVDDGAGEPDVDPEGDVGAAEGEIVSRPGRDRCAPKQFTPDPPDKCGRYMHLACGLPAGVTPGANCYLWLNDCKKVCPGAYFNCHAVGDSCKNGEIVPDATGAVDIDCATCAKGVGRIPAGLAPAVAPRAPSAVGRYFAAVAHLEEAAVHAFDRLHRELASSGAPAHLLEEAQRARRDEVRHTKLTARVARRFGGEPVPPRVEEVADRPLDAVAVENAVEGCVRETYGALVASFQAEHAADPQIARVMRTIARDETRHAALSWAILRWAAPRLDAEAHAEMSAKCQAAIEALHRETEVHVPDELKARAGLPDAAQQRALLAALEAQVWSAWANGAASA